MKSFVLALSLLPSLLVAPYAFSDSYASYEASELESEIVNGKNYYKSEIKNTGNNYIDISGCYLASENAKNEALGAYSEVIAPGKSKTIYFENKYEDKVFTKENINVNAYADAVRDLITFKDFGAKTFEAKQSKNYFGEDTIIYQYFFEVNFEISKKFDSYYSLMFVVNYNGENHSYYQYDFNKEENPYKLRFKSEENINVNSIEVKDVFLLKGNNYYEEHAKKEENDAVKRGLIAGAIALGVIAAIIIIVLLLRKLFSQKHA